MCVRHDIESSKHSRRRPEYMDRIDWLVADCMSNKQIPVDGGVLEASYNCRCSARISALDRLGDGKVHT